MHSDPNLEARTRRRESVDVGVGAVGDQPAAATLATRPARGLGRLTEQAGREV